MPLTAIEYDTLFEVLEIPPDPYAFQLIGEFALAMEENDLSQSIRQAKARVDSYLAASIYTSASRLAMLQALIGRWITIGTNAIIVDAGTVGSITGVTIDPDRERLLLRQRIIRLVPFMRYHEEMQRFSKKSAQGGGLQFKITP
jgi:hypothetical protein